MVKALNILCRQYQQFAFIIHFYGRIYVACKTFNVDSLTVKSRQGHRAQTLKVTRPADFGSFSVDYYVSLRY